jgi:hypothetical protein
MNHHSSLCLNAKVLAPFCYRRSSFTRHQKKIKIKNDLLKNEYNKVIDILNFMKSIINH